MRRAIHPMPYVAALLATLVATATEAAGEERRAPVPIETFFRNPDVAAARLSPSGRWLALTTSARNSRVLLAVVDVSSETREPRVIVNFSDVDVRSFEWVNDDRLVFNTIDGEAPLNDQAFGPGLYSVKRDGSEMKMLVRPRYAMVVQRSGTLAEPLTPNHELIGPLRDGSEDVLVAEYRYTMAGELDWVNPKRLDTSTGRTVSLARGAPEHAIAWVIDAEGRPRALTTRSRGFLESFWKKDDVWTSIARSPTNATPFHPIAVDGEGRLYVSAPTHGFSSLKRFDFSTSKPEAEPLVSAKGFDLSPRLRVSARGELLGLGYETDAAASIWFDPTYRELQKTIDARFPGHTNSLQCGSDCRTSPSVLVLSSSDQDPGTYHLYRPKAESWEVVGVRRSAVDPAAMAQVDFHRTKARDGEDLPIWVTTPRGKSDRPRPGIVLVHGGPWVRGGHWAWEPDGQFLASRGYVVIEPEFRGSLGYGFHHFRAGFKKWAGPMQDDLVDALQWAVDRGLVDRSRVCIAGASYGGYATLMSLAKYPDTYRCGVAWLAVSDPRLLFTDSWSSDMPAEARRYTMPEMIGDPVADADLLRDSAPVEHAKSIRAPLLMAFGSLDRRVPIEHGERMRDALRSAGRNPEYVVYEGEGHGFLKVENRIDFWTRVEKFLATNLQP